MLVQETHLVKNVLETVTATQIVQVILNASREMDLNKFLAAQLVEVEMKADMTIVMMHQDWSILEVQAVLQINLAKLVTEIVMPILIVLEILNASKEMGLLLYQDVPLEEVEM
jgi:hypothetical protein